MALAASLLFLFLASLLSASLAASITCPFGYSCLSADECNPSQRRCPATCPNCSRLSNDNCAPGKKCCRCQSGALDDPFMIGLQGQSFLFDGKDDTWYSLIHDPEKLNLNIHIYSPTHDGKTSYIDGIGVTAKSEDGEEHKVLLKIKDTSDFEPKCVGKNGEAKKLCVANGALKIVIDDKEVIRPGYHDMDDLSFSAFNAPFECKLVPESHNRWDEIEAARLERLESVAKHHARHLEIFEPSNDFLAHLEFNDVFEPDQCKKWVKERKEKDDLYKQKGSLSTIFFDFKDFAMRIEFVVNDDLNGKWVKHQRFDITLLGFKATEDSDGKPLAAGVLGETAILKFDDVLGTPILKGRESVLSGKDEDYEVAGPFGKDFSAKDFAKLRKLMAKI